MVDRFGKFQENGTYTIRDRITFYWTTLYV